jgi:hypothetical protein
MTIKIPSKIDPNDIIPKISTHTQPDKGCSSLVGMKGGNQFINLNKDTSCANRKGIIMHEILHALGFHHMHTHSARDRYIRFYEKNIKNFLTNRNFFLNDAARTSSFNTKYDFYSIMHYPPFNSNGDRMIKPQKKYMYYDDFMGQRKTLSDGDIERVNGMYGCTGGGGGSSGAARIQNSDIRPRPSAVKPAATTPCPPTSGPSWSRLPMKTQSHVQSFYREQSYQKTTYTQTVHEQNDDDDDESDDDDDDDDDDESDDDDDDE